MTALARLTLGAPGVYTAPELPTRALSSVRLDLCGFAGVAPRGPARVPVIEDEVGGHYWPADRPWVEPERPRLRTVAVLVEGFDDYRRLFGGFEGPGRLPYAVASYFENGGRRALVARIVHDYGAGDPRNHQGVARGRIDGLGSPIHLRARNEGSWGAGIRATLHFTARPLDLTLDGGGLRLGAGSASTLVAGSLVRAELGQGVRVLRFVTGLVRAPDGAGLTLKTLALLDQPLPVGLEPSTPPRFELVEADLTLDDGDGRVERHQGLGLAFGHPRWMAQVLCESSELAWPEPDWSRAQVEPAGPDLPDPPVARFDLDGVPQDRWADLTPEDFFDAGWTAESGEPGSGICCFAPHRDPDGIGDRRAASLVAPDLYSPSPLAPFAPILDPLTLAGPSFAPCVAIAQSGEQTRPEDPLPGLHLDPLLDLEAILILQGRLIDFAESSLDLVALIDCPPGLDPARIRRWRSRFGSSYAAAYHPWLKVTRRDDGRDALVDLPPSAAAAGILAGLELTFGIPHGPANRLVVEAVQVASPLSPALHAELHQSGLNCLVAERDGIRLTGARTLSRDPAWRQLSVRRLLIQMRRVLLAQMQWAVFEPNGPALWREVRRLLTTYLRGLYLAGAFRGEREEDAFFVRCDASLNPRCELDLGRLVAEVGVAPAEPIEFIVLRISRGGDGTLTINESGAGGGYG